MSKDKKISKWRCFCAELKMDDMVSSQQGVNTGSKVPTVSYSKDQKKINLPLKA